mmetsp:Transcript_2368/g.7088  ORF Transcript_2368/g.7088 Transcript_2368/m.7088 type:complete len:245 (+) Transcript_2368:668-1402(+)
MANYDLERHEKAWIDFKAATALLRVAWESESGFWSAVDFAEDMMLSLAKWKKKTSPERPHFEKDEREKVKKELRLREYAESHYKCAVCATSGYDGETKLLRCTCGTVFYCSTSCQRSHWNGGAHKDAHKKAIAEQADGRGPEKVLTLLQDEERPFIEDCVERQGGALVLHHMGPELVVRDPKTGRLYELVSDHDVSFLSEVDTRGARRIPKPPDCPYERAAQELRDSGARDEAIAAARARRGLE